MAENDGVTLRSIQWSEIFPWLGLIRTFRLAITLRALVLGALAIFLTLLGWAFIAWLFANKHPEDLPAGQRDLAAACWNDTFHGLSAWGVIDHAVPNKPYLPFVPLRTEPTGVAEAPGTPPVVAIEPALRKPAASHLAIVDPATWQPHDPFFGTWAHLSRPMWRIFLEPEMTVAGLACLVFSALWSLAVAAFFGGAISRIAAVQLAADERIGWASALRWAAAKWSAYFAAPLFPMLGILLLVIPLAVLGLLARADVGALLLALIWPALLLVGLVMAILLLGVILGWPLMWGTISSEGTDTFDALSRTYAYVFQRPLRYLFYAVLAAVLGWLGWLLVAEFAAGVIWLTAWATSWGGGGQRVMGELLDGNALAGAKLIHFWSVCVKCLAVGYAYSFFWTAATAIYFLLRRDVDATETDEVHLDADQTEPSPGLAPITTDAAGAPQVADSANPPAAAEENDKDEG
jgi:hypothetical protein